MPKSTSEAISAFDPEQYEAARKRLWDDLVHLKDHWHQYVTLYASAPATVALLNRHARWFFGSLQRSLIRDLILGVSRLTDAPGTGDKANLVLTELLRDPKLAEDHGLRDELTTRIAAVCTRAAPIRAHRHKYIAHRDYAVALGRSEDLLPQVQLALLDAILEELTAIYAVHGLRLHGTSYAFDLEALGSVDALLRSLERADKWRAHEVAEKRRALGLPLDGPGASKPAFGADGPAEPGWGE